MRQSGRERAYTALKEFVLGDPSVAGTFVNEQEFADKVGVSRTPVREALLLLAGEELVRLVPGRGALVLAPSPTQVREILQAREVIESWALDAVLSGTASSSPLAAMGESLRRQEELLVHGAPPTAVIEEDREFHTHLVQAPGNAIMADMYETLRARHVLLGTEALVRRQGRAQEVIAEHRAIIDAVAAQDPAAARRALRDHLESTRQSLIES